MTPLAVRRSLDRDLPFILKSWLDSFRTSHAAGVLPMAFYYDTYHQVLTDDEHGILARPGVECWCAVNPDEPDPAHEIYGFLCLERDATEPRKVWNPKTLQSEAVTVPVPQLIHYAYVKDHLRSTPDEQRNHVGLRVLTAMTKAAGLSLRQPLVYTFKTPTGTSVAQHLGAHIRFNPLIARYPK